jgi:large subunit ribosomal protein L13Ae
MFNKLIVIDAKGHLAGRLASYVAKELLNGQRVTIVRCEKTLISGSNFRNRLKVMDFRNKRMSTNPRKGPFHQRAPSLILHRKIRGMVPHKMKIGKAAMGRLKCFDGVPLSLNGKKKMVIRDALRCVRLKPRAKFCVLGEVATVCGWKHAAIIDTLENKRIGRNREWHLNRMKTRKEKDDKLTKNSEIKKLTDQLAEYGY